MGQVPVHPQQRREIRWSRRHRRRARPTWTSPTNAGRRARRSSPSTRRAPSSSPPARTRSSGCPCAATSPATAAPPGAASTCRCPTPSAPTASASAPIPRSPSTARGNLFYGYIVVFFGDGNGINGTGMAVARSTDGGKTYPQATFFGFDGGSDHFNDKPMITADTSAASRFRDNVYIAWDAASGGSASGGGIRVARSSDHGTTFTVEPRRRSLRTGQVHRRHPSPSARRGSCTWPGTTSPPTPSSSTRSLDGGATWGTRARPRPQDRRLRHRASPPNSFRRALVYPGLRRGHLGGGPPRPHLLLVDGPQRRGQFRHPGQRFRRRRRHLDRAVAGGGAAVATSTGSTTGSRATRSRARWTSPSTTRATTPPASAS